MLATTPTRTAAQNFRSTWLRGPHRGCFGVHEKHLEKRRADEQEAVRSIKTPSRSRMALRTCRRARLKKSGNRRRGGGPLP
jgi:hypothetical protein